MRRKKILLVDDSSATLVLQRLLLHRAPYAIVTATEPHQAVTKARTERPDLILMGETMAQAGPEAREALVQVRADAARAGVPVVMVTARGGDHDGLGGFTSGCSDYLTKPVNSVELLSKLRNLLDD